MINNEKVKHLFYIDKDTKPEVLLKEIVKKVEKEWGMLIEHKHKQLLMSDDENFVTLEVELQQKDSPIDRMHFFFRGAVVPYFTRQYFNFWKKTIPTHMVTEATDIMKRKIGFTLYNKDGYKTEEPNSVLTLKLKSDWLQFLDDVENVCFKDEEFIFPNSDYFNELVREKGRTAAQRQAIGELFEKVRNKYQDRDIPDL